MADPLAHMTVQHRGFAAAARGHGADLAQWQAASLVDAVLPLVLAVPDGDFREADDSPFARAVDAPSTTTLDRILRYLGRRPDWTQEYSTVTGA